MADYFCDQAFCEYSYTNFKYYILSPVIILLLVKCGLRNNCRRPLTMGARADFYEDIQISSILFQPSGGCCGDRKMKFNSRTLMSLTLKRRSHSFFLELCLLNRRR